MIDKQASEDLAHDAELARLANRKSDVERRWLLHHAEAARLLAESRVIEREDAKLGSALGPVEGA